MSSAEEKQVVKAFKKYVKMSKENRDNAYLDGKNFVKGTLGKVDGYYFYPVTKHGEKIIRVIKEFSVESRVITTGDISTNHLKTVDKEDIWDITFEKNGKIKDVLDLLHGERSIHEVYLGLTNDNIKTINLNEYINEYKKEIEYARKKYLSGSMCEEIENLIKCELNKIR